MIRFHLNPSFIRDFKHILWARVIFRSFFAFVYSSKTLDLIPELNHKMGIINPEYICNKTRKIVFGSLNC
jgi:hypothetical protein